MAYDIGPKIGIEGEVDFRNAIKQINENMKTLGTEMKVVASQFDKNDNSTKALTARSEVLNKQIDEQKNKLSELEKGLKAAGEKYGENDKVTQGWQRAVNQATAELNIMERELKDNTDAMGKAKNPADDLGKEIKKVGDNAEKAGQKTLSMGDVIKANLISQAIISGVKALANSFVGLAKGALDSADSVQQMSDVTGMSAETIQEWKYVGDTLGTSIDTITGAQAKLTKSMASAQSGSAAAKNAFKELKINVTDLHGGLRDAQETMGDVFDALAKVENPTKRDALAMQIFGKSAMDLNPLISAGSDEISRLADEAKKSGAVMSNETVAGLDNFGDSLGQLKQSLTGAAGTILNEITPNLQGFIDKVKNIDTKPIIDALKWVIDNSGTIVSGVVGIGTALLTWNVVSMVTGLVEAIKAFQLANEGATIAQAALNVVMDANPIGIVIVAVAGLVAAVVTLWNTNEGFRTAVVGVWNDVYNTVAWVVNGVVGFVKNNWQQLLTFLVNPISGALGLLYKLNPQFREWVNSVSSTIINGFNSAINFITSLPSEAVTWGKDMIEGIVKGIKAAAHAVGDAVNGVAQDIRKFLHFSVPDEGPLVDYESWMPDFMQGLAHGIEKSKFLVSDAVKRLSLDMAIGIKTPMASDITSNFNNSGYNNQPIFITVQSILDSQKLSEGTAVYDNKIQGSNIAFSGRSNGM